MHGAAGVREGAEALRALRVAALALALGACRRAPVEPRGAIAGAWLREPELASGFELRADGRLALLNRPQQSGLAWSLARGELALSLCDAAHPDAHVVVQLTLARLAGDALELAGDDARFAGTYARARAEHVRGVLTYRERMALPPDAHVEVELSREGVGPVALAVFAPEGQVPIGFELSVPAAPDESPRYSLRARIADRERSLWVTPDPVAVAAEAENAPVLLRFAR
ncbi:MAG TPA: YbaY family lipoprotein [Myxococcota bacterium]|nr:YbaY family lipoprotein [Myxococcota bacterium]